MKRGHTIAIASVILAGALAFSLRSRQAEPEFKGYKLSQWIEVYEDNSHFTTDSVDAIQHIGTNALPTLLQWINYDPPGWRLYLANWFGTHGQQRLYHLAMGTRAKKSRLAIGGFHALGTNAEPAIPDLLRQLGSKSPSVSHAALLALVSLPSSQSVIQAQGLTNTDVAVRANAALYSNIFSNMAPQMPPPFH